MDCRSEIALRMHLLILNQNLEQDVDWKFQDPNTSHRRQQMPKHMPPEAEINIVWTASPMSCHLTTFFQLLQSRKWQASSVSVRCLLSLHPLPTVKTRACSVWSNALHKRCCRLTMRCICFLSLALPLMHIPQSWVKSCMADVHKVLEATVPQFHRQIKMCRSVQIKTRWMSLNWHLNCRDVYQSRLECLDGRGHNDISQQLVPNPNSSREETVIEVIDTPSWNTGTRVLSYSECLDTICCLASCQTL